MIGDDVGERDLVALVVAKIGSVQAWPGSAPAKSSGDAEQRKWAVADLRGGCFEDEAGADISS